VIAEPSSPAACRHVLIALENEPYPYDRRVRQEAEALGPARREVAPAETEDGDGTGEQAPAEHAGEAGHMGEPEPVAGEAEPVAESELQVEHAAEPEEALPFDSDEHARVSDTPTQGFEAVGYDDQERVVRSHGDALLEDEGEPFDEDDLADEDDLTDDDDDSREAAADDADVLEDTPDFLQETPEHDRLWFEQKPPRDFDFD